MTEPVSNTPQTDANGNPLPAAGAPPGTAAPAGIVAGTPDLATAVAQAFLAHSASIAQNSPIAKSAAAADAAKKAAAVTPAVDRPVPPAGSSGSKLEAAGRGVIADLGDAAHASDTKGGWLSGIVNTLNARNARLAQQAKDDQLLAKSQAETIALHRNMYAQDEAHRAVAYKGNQDLIDTYKENHDIETGVSQDDLMKRMQTDKDFAKKYFVRATSDVPMFGPDGKPQTDKFGNPVTMPLYSVITQATKTGEPDDKTVTAQQSADFAKYTGSTIPVGTKLTSKQMYALDTQMNGARNATTILQNTNGHELNADQMKALQPYLNDPTVQHAISSKPGSAYAGVAEAMQNASAHIAAAQQEATQAKSQNNQAALDTANAKIAQFQDERQKLQTFTAQAISPKQIDEYDKKAGDATSFLTDLQKKADGAHGEEAAAIAASTTRMLQDPDNTYTPQQKAILTRIQSQATAAAKASQDWEVEKEKRKAEITNALNEENLPTLVGAALEYDLNPDKIYTMRKDQNAAFKAEVIRQAAERGIHWTDADYKARYNMKQDLAKDTPTSMGGQIDSLNRYAFHAATANRGIEGLRNMGSPIVNLPLNKIKSTMVGFPEAQAFKIEAETMKDEYLNFIKNGHVPPTAQEERLAALINDSRTPAELQDTMRAMAELVGGRAKGMNGRYNTIMGGGSIPGLLQPDSANILRQFGVDVDAITKPNELTSFSRPITRQTQGQAQKEQSQPNPQVHNTDVQRPKDLPTATATKDFKNKAGQVQTYWTDAAGKPLRLVGPNELPKE